MRACEVSVVIPTRNRWRLLSRRGLRSALIQRDVVHEVIVVDDGSTDETADRLARLGEPLIRVIQLERRSGVAHARNAGIAAAAGTFVAFLDDDDLWAPLKLRTQLDAVAAADADFAYTGVASVDAAGAAQYVFPLPEPEQLERSLLVASVLPAGCSSVVARAELVRRLGGFDERLHQLADWDLWIRLARAGRAAVCEEILVAYLEHADNMLLSDRGEVMEELAYVEKKHRARRCEHAVVLDRRRFAHWVAWGYLRRGQRLRAARAFARSARENAAPRDLALAAAFAARAMLPIPGARRALQRLPRTNRAAPPSAPPARLTWLDAGGTDRDS